MKYLELYCHIPTINYYYGDLKGTQYFRIYDSSGNFLAHPAASGLVSYKAQVLGKINLVFMYVLQRKAVAKYCDFKEITIYYEGQDYSLTISPNPLQGEKGYRIYVYCNFQWYSSEMIIVNMFGILGTILNQYQK